MHTVVSLRHKQKPLTLTLSRRERGLTGLTGVIEVLKSKEIGSRSSGRGLG
jgi:hypothetical protein